MPRRASGHCKKNGNHATDAATHRCHVPRRHRCQDRVWRFGRRCVCAGRVPPTGRPTAQGRREQATHFPGLFRRSAVRPVRPTPPARGRVGNGSVAPSDSHRIENRVDLPRRMDCTSPAIRPMTCVDIRARPPTKGATLGFCPEGRPRRRRIGSPYHPRVTGKCQVRAATGRRAAVLAGAL